MCVLSTTQVAEFALKNYGPNRVTAAIVGDVTPDQVCVRTTGKRLPCQCEW